MIAFNISHPGQSDASDVSPPDTAGKLGGVLAPHEGAAIFFSETRKACEPPPSGSQAPVSVSSPALTGADPLSSIIAASVHDLCDMSAHLAPASFTHHQGGERAYGDRDQRQDHHQFNVEHVSNSVVHAEQ